MAHHHHHHSSGLEVLFQGPMSSNMIKADCVVIEDSFRGFPTEYFCTSPRYDECLDYVLIPNGMIKDRLEKMSMNIVDYYEACNATSITLMCVLKGGFKFLADLVDGLERTVRARGIVLPMSVEFVRVKSYVNDVSIHEPILTGLGDPSEYKDKNVLVVEDIIDTGKTITKLISHLDSLSTKSVKVASLLVKRTSPRNDYRPDFVGFEVPNRFVVGYALDYNDNFRDLHHICVINEVGQKKFSVPCTSKPV
uniref:Hypoxanthine-guanine phosphoribosyltransferase (HGPRT) n=1 Tax=Schistosoma mansoni TaxID=6183 RepID=UPI0009A09EF8|nr:Chain A, Hypoxanthine-guanine phosphoribosyltransferase (HGPRT) [Schistosoma mansoni]5IPF_B Chain B, Hypoxanthine-guanine phosphoribosyltransferase (HGPRT) [Schistosoma mansoni]5IPF_C Chain C, Hypoxanthine-guanine phosphoribosyltransferase (HGPRT) [Schistosoma mansoni]5IPF_D Chain D, Hypoxanthine-guanine phosphoribosyltransferase (HGPRT) [Schistosoma mansoni]